MKTDAADKTFIYAGRVFHPYGTFTERESFDAVSVCLYRINMIPDKNWNYQDFYKAAGAIGENCDIFVCTGIFVVPCDQGLYAYRRKKLLSKNN